MPRRARMYLSGVSYHIVQRGNNREPCFFAVEDYQFYLELLTELLPKYEKIGVRSEFTNLIPVKDMKNMKHFFAIALFLVCNLSFAFEGANTFVGADRVFARLLVSDNDRYIQEVVRALYSSESRNKALLDLTALVLSENLKKSNYLL